MGSSLILSKVKPFSLHPSIKKIYIFSEYGGPAPDKSEYITLPAWIGKLKPAVLRKLTRAAWEPLQLVWYSLKLKPSFINGYHLIPKGLNSLLAARLTGTKCIISVIGGIIEIETYSRLKFLLRRLNLAALRNADLVTTKGSVVNGYIEKHGVRMSGVVVFNGSVDTDKFCPGPEEERPTDFLFIGTFRSLKGPDRVLRIAALLKESYPGLKLTMIGDGVLYESCRELAEELGLGGSVDFTGSVADPSLFCRRSKVFVLPSESEGLPTSMLEAMSAGCVPVVSDVGNIRDIAIHGENAFVAGNCTDLNSFAGHISALLSDPALRERMSEEARATVLRSFTPELQCQVVDRMLDKLFG